MSTALNSKSLLDIPAGKWFGPADVASDKGKLETWSWLKALASAHYERDTDRAILTAHNRQFLFQWQIEEKEEVTMVTNADTINWSELSPEQRDELVATHIMHEHVAHLPAQQHQHFMMPEVTALIDEHGLFISGVPRYTQSMDAAWRVAVTFTDSIVNLTNVPGAYHHCRIKPFVNYRRAHHGFRMNAAEAICVAALRASGLTVIHSEEDIINAHQNLATD